MLSQVHMTVCNRFTYLLTVLLKIILIFGFLYLFICALGFLSNAFKLVGGKAAGKVFRENDLLTNPVAGLMIGVLVTVLLQSSSTTTSIIITMVGSEIIPIKTAIPMVMGANIGTSVTNTLVSLAQSSDREVFRKAFGGATVHDMFNWLTVIVLLPIESTVHYLYHLTGVIVRSLELSKSGKKKDLLKVITKPFTGLIVKVDKHVITNIALNKEGAEEGSVLKRWCKTVHIPYNSTVSHHEEYNSTLIEKLETEGTRYTLGIMSDSNTSFIKWETNETLVKKINMERCHNLFAQTDLSDSTIGALLLVISLFVIAVALIFMVKLLNSLLKGSVAKVVKRFINSDFPGLFKYLTGYVAILIGTGTTMIIQSSSVFTSILTPLVGVGVVSLDRMLPLTLGANIGTCLTGILAALANPAKAIPNALQVALCHLFFNISGVLLFYPIPITRKAPINLAKGLGNITAKYRWFSILYLILVFIALPGLVFVLSLAGTVPFAVVGSIILLILVCLIVINIAQKYCLGRLPSWLRNWNFLPLCCRSLKPIDKLISSVLGIFVCCRNQEKETDMSGKGCDNKAFTIL
ncbi:sodium-dependent phosphate transport protein 2B-like [Mytilus californianus]|uniref:sodium-dependent phosphate transport protein 2B-like n=1 Tax=Mytilus californianus TaxID=6549 RepID=UPI002246B281|nr:sodium-dependent phosphate transport protein 2B-like [Mytilus californianus]